MVHTKVLPKFPPYTGTGIGPWMALPSLEGAALGAWRSGSVAGSQVITLDGQNRLPGPHRRVMPSDSKVTHK